MRHIELTEGRPARTIELSDGEAEALGAAELVDLSRPPGESSWSIAPGSKVGAVQSGGLQVTVKPKILVKRIVFLMGYATSPDFWRESPVGVEAEEGLPEALAHAFATMAVRATRKGLIQGYRRVEDSLPVLRGRIRVNAQISRHYGNDFPLEVGYDDFTADIPENQILLAAATRLLRVPSLASGVRRSLQRLRFELAGVTDIGTRTALPMWRATRLNARYVPALRLAERILAGQSFEQRAGDLQVSGFVFDLWRIYEDFVSVALREALAARGTASLQHRMHLDHAEKVALRPDFYWLGHDGRRVVVDAKYKAEKPSGFPQADLYQLLAYCTVLGLSDGHLIYASGNEAETVHRIRGSGIAIHCHTLDLDVPPDDLLAQIHDIAQRILLVESGRRSA